MSDLIDFVANLGREAFAAGLPDTRHISRIFGDGGRKRSLYVASRTYNTMMKGDAVAAKSLDGEWLYDMSWYTPEKHYEELVLVLESELSRDQKGEVDNDFGKLVQARATVRVWIAKAATSDLANAHIDACMASASAFKASLDSDTYLFFVFDKQTGQVVSCSAGLGTCRRNARSSARVAPPPAPPSSDLR